jgi:SAM-dependent methyltransferase
MKWYPTPSYLLKRKVIIDALRTTGAATFLEVGCGAGDLLLALDRAGYRGMGIDISAEAIEVAREHNLSANIRVEQRDMTTIEERFDAVIASEVLEHWEDDLGFLRLLVDRIAPDGWLLLTVPAHQSKWGANDDFCGHVRRYERADLQAKLVAAGLDSIRICSYGVPLYNLMKPFYDRAIVRQLEQESKLDERTRNSGGMWLFTDMSTLFNLLFNDITMLPFYLLQRLFFATDLGNGYFAIARKPR